MPNNDDVNAILEQLRARTQQRLSGEAAAQNETAAKPASNAEDAAQLLQQLREQREQHSAAADEAAQTPETSVLPPVPGEEQHAAPAEEKQQPAETAQLPPQQTATAENSLPEPGIFAGIDTAEEIDTAALREREKAERARLRQSRQALLEKQRGGEKNGFFKTVGQILLFLLVVAAVILAVLYLLQTLAGVEIINVKEIFDSSARAVISGLRLILRLI